MSDSWKTDSPLGKAELALASRKRSPRTRHLNQVELADRWGLSPRTLENWRWRGEGPPFVKIGRKVVYRLIDVEAYEHEQLRTKSRPMDGKADGC
jgi:Helix-turn-helix domain